MAIGIKVQIAQEIATTHLNSRRVKKKSPGFQTLAYYVALAVGKVRAVLQQKIG